MAEASPVALFSPARFAFFRVMFHGFARRHLRAVRVARWGLPPADDPARPLVVYANHPSWWDGVAFMLYSTALFPGRRMFIPMEATALDRYAFMRRLGVFGVEQQSTRGAVAFLRTARTVLATPGSMLWMNAPGRFMDVRERPVTIAQGLARLAELAPTTRFLPMALDYPFWTERGAEMLCAYGPPLDGAALAALPREVRGVALARALEGTMDRLAVDALARDPDRFHAIVAGKEGMGGVYERWRHLRAMLRGEAFDPRHDRGPRGEVG